MKTLLLFFSLVYSISIFAQPAGCINYTKSCAFSCHQYVRGCATGLVNLNTMIPYSDASLCNLSTTNIKDAVDFIRVCSNNNADGASLDFVDHSSYRIHNYHYIATPNPGSQLLCSGNESAGSGSTAYQSAGYFSYIGDVNVTGSSQLQIGTDYTYQITNLPSGVNFNVASNSNYQIISTASSSFVLRPLVSITNLSLNVNLVTASGCSGGQTRTKSIIINIGSPCTGLLNNNSLYTYNSTNVTSNAVVMSSTGWTWSRTGGTASYSTSNSGKNLNFSLPSGYVNFQATRSGCGTLNFTFNRSSYMVRPDEQKDDKIEVFDINTGKRLKSYSCINCEETNEEIVSELQNGIYVIKRNGVSTKYIKVIDSSRF